MLSYSSWDSPFRIPLISCATLMVRSLACSKHMEQEIDVAPMRGLVRKMGVRPHQVVGTRVSPRSPHQGVPRWICSVTQRPYPARPLVSHFPYACTARRISLHISWDVSVSSNSGYSFESLVICFFSLCSSAGALRSASPDRGW